MDREGIDNDLAKNMALMRMSNATRRRSSFCDRFIPSRREVDLEAASHRLASLNSSQNDSVCSASSWGSMADSPWKNDIVSTVSKRRNSSTFSDEGRILVFSPRTPARTNSQGLAGPQDCYTPQSYTPRRHLPQSPERILDMPDVRDDFYCNILDWNSRNTITVAIEDCLYMWNVENEACQELNTSGDESLSSAIVKSLAWDPMSKHLAIGTVEGDVRIWIKEKKEMKQVKGTIGRTLGETDGLAWDRSGTSLYSIHSGGSLCHITLKPLHTEVHDLNIQRGASGIKISEDNKHLAIGANDGHIRIWNIQEKKISCIIQAHSTATKAISWLPWKKHVLFSGGGSGDGTIRMWDTKSSELLEETQTDSQVCSMVISGLHKEMVTGHGIEHNDIIIWALPKMTIVGKLQFQGGRVLHLALNHKEDMLASLSADESLMLWKCFARIEKKSRLSSGSCLNTRSPLSITIR